MSGPVLSASLSQVFEVDTVVTATSSRRKIKQPQLLQSFITIPREAFA